MVPDEHEKGHQLSLMNWQLQRLYEQHKFPPAMKSETVCFKAGAKLCPRCFADEPFFNPSEIEVMPLPTCEGSCGVE